LTRSLSARTVTPPQQKNWPEISGASTATAIVPGEKVMISKNHWNVYCTRFMVRARQLTEPFAFTDPFGHEHVGRPGDYLVETSNGTRRIAPRDFFEDVYLPLSAAAPSPVGSLPDRRSPASITRHSVHAAEDRPHVMAF
jgi:hypothetical protein